MKEPPSIIPATTPGPLYDPMDWIVQNMENVESFLSYLAMFKDRKYLDKHLSSILALRRTLSDQIDKLAEDPYNYPASRLKTLHQQNETLFVRVEAVVEAVIEGDEKKLKKFMDAAGNTFSKMDDDITP